MYANSFYGSRNKKFLGKYVPNLFAVIEKAKLTWLLSPFRHPYEIDFHKIKLYVHLQYSVRSAWMTFNKNKKHCCQGTSSKLEIDQRSG